MPSRTLRDRIDRNDVVIRIFRSAVVSRAKLLPPGFSLFLAVGMLAPVGIALLRPTPAAIDPAWDWANALGYLGLAVSLLLFVYAGRARAFPPYSGRFFANLHRDLGYIALLLIGAHVVILLVREPLLLEHLKPTAPLHMLAGLLALILLMLLALWGSAD